MPFDPFSWALGYGLSTAASKARDSLFGKTLEKRLRIAVVTWAKDLQKRNLGVEPTALFPKLSDATTPSRQHLKETLEARQIPTEKDWADAIMESWRSVREELGKDAQDFFQVEEGIANVEINRLSEVLHKECANDEELFRGNVLDSLRRMEDAASDSQVEHKPSPLYQSPLPTRLNAWFEALGYRFEQADFSGPVSRWLLNIPARRGFDRIVVHAVEGEASSKELTSLVEHVRKTAADEGWIVADVRISNVVRTAVKEASNVYCYTFDELIDEDTALDEYIEWLESEVNRLGINNKFVPLGCRKREPRSRKEDNLHSEYSAEDGGVEAYLDRWLDDPSAEHISILGEFGTGKTWLVLHFAWTLVQRYKEAKERGVARPRLPIVVPLRDYAKAVSLTSLLSEFFFRKHSTKLRTFEAFECLNRLGKIVLLFDGFDEMAVRIDRQKMINNFWEIATAIQPGAKVVLTCRNEHFPDADEGRALLSAELKASTSAINLESPKFELLELKMLEQWQIKECLLQRTDAQTTDRIMNDDRLADLVRRPLMVDMLLDALPDLEDGKKSIDLFRVYFYAVTRKLERDIRIERTFTSLADKLYFMCELSWEMLSTDKMNISFKQFPDRIIKAFGHRIDVDIDLDHWHYDMSGQTMLIRDENGNYAPAHRSLLEFFVAYSSAAYLGFLPQEFMECLRIPDSPESPSDCSWTDFFQQESNNNRNLKQFTQESIEMLAERLGAWKFSRAALELISPIIPENTEALVQDLLSLIRRTSAIQNPGTLGSNLLALILLMEPDGLRGENLSGSNLDGASFNSIEYSGPTNLNGINFRNCSLKNVRIDTSDLSKADFSGADLSGSSFTEWQIDGASIHPTEQSAVISSYYDLMLWTSNERRILRHVVRGAWKVKHSVSGEHVAVSGWNQFALYDALSLTLISKFVMQRPADIEESKDGCIGESDNCWITTFAFTSTGSRLFAGSNDGIVYEWDTRNREQLRTFRPKLGHVESISLNPNEDCLCVQCYGGLSTWNIASGKKISTVEWNKKSAHIVDSYFDFEGNILVPDFTCKVLEKRDAAALKVLAALELEGKCEGFAIGQNGNLLCVVRSDAVIDFYDYPTMSLVHRIDVSKDARVTSRNASYLKMPGRAVAVGDRLAVVSINSAALFINTQTGSVDDVVLHLPPMDGTRLVGTQGISQDQERQFERHGAILH